MEGPERRSCATCGRTMDVVEAGPTEARLDGCDRAAACGFAKAGRYVVVSPAPERARARATDPEAAGLAAYA